MLKQVELIEQQYNRSIIYTNNKLFKTFGGAGFR